VAVGGPAVKVPSFCCRGAGLDASSIGPVHVGNVSTPLVIRVMAATPRRSIVFADRAEVHATEHRHVVGAVDGDRDQWLAVPFGGDAVKLSVNRLAGAQLLDRRLRVVGAVAPVAVRRPA